MDISFDTSHTRITPEHSGDTLGRLFDLLPLLLLKNPGLNQQGKPLIEAPMFLNRFDLLVTSLLGKVANTFRLKVDFASDLAEWIRTGNDGDIAPEMTAENFTSDDELLLLLRQVIPLNFTRTISNQELIQEGDTLNLRPGPHLEPLALVDIYIYLMVQREAANTTIGAGSHGAGNSLHAAYFDLWHTLRKRRIEYFDSGWSVNNRFVASPTSTSQRVP